MAFFFGGSRLFVYGVEIMVGCFSVGGKKVDRDAGETLGVESD